MMMKLIIIAVSMINQNKKIIESYFFLFYLNKENLKFLFNQSIIKFTDFNEK